MKAAFFLIACIAMLFSCKKNAPPNTQEEAYKLYRLQIKDNDNLSTYSVTQVVRSGANTSFNCCDTEEDGKESDACYCKKHPEDQKCKTLPVQLEYFVTKKSDSQLLVEWRTSYESNVRYFQIEMSTDSGVTYSNFGAPVYPKGPGIYKVSF